jgi:fructose-1,6-bisphosphatase II
MLYIGEEVGGGTNAVDIAVDPVEGTNLVAKGLPNAIAVIAVAERGGLLHAPDIYMDKLIVGPTSAGHVDIRRPVEENLAAMALALRRSVTDLVITILDRPRHAELIARVRGAGARIKLISDGDVSAAIAAAVRGTGVHGVMGIGGAPEGVLAAAALRCLGGEMQGRFWYRNEGERERVRSMGVDDPDRVFGTDELAPGNSILFAATGITDGDLFRGVRFFGGGARTHSLVMTRQSGEVRFIESIHILDRTQVGAIQL